MIAPELHRYLSALPNEDVRQVITHAAGIHAHRDRDNGEKIAGALHRIADRISHKAHA